MNPVNSGTSGQLRGGTALCEIVEGNKSAAQVCSPFTELRSICRSLLERVHALKNEVVDVGVVLYELAALFQRRTVLFDNRQSLIPYLLRQAGETSKHPRRSAEHNSGYQALSCCLQRVAKRTARAATIARGSWTCSV